MQKICDQLCGDGHSRLILTVLPGVAKKWNHGRDSVRAGTTCSINHDEQFHEMLISGRASWLDDEYITATDVFIDLDVSFTIRKRADRGLSKWDPNSVADPLSKVAVGGAAENLHFGLMMGKHDGGALSCRSK